MAPIVAPQTPTKRPRREESKSEQHVRLFEEMEEVLGDDGAKKTACSEQDHFLSIFGDEFTTVADDDVESFLIAEDTTNMAAAQEE